MKTTYINILAIFLFFNGYCKAQEVIIPLEPAQASAQAVLDYPEETVLYFRDTNNNLDKFEGNWLFNNGIHYIEIEITKYTHVSNGYEGYNDNDFEDRLLLRMEYRLNGVEQYNYDTTVGISGSTFNNYNTVELYYNEPSLTSCSRRKLGNLKLEHTVNFPNPPQLIWNRTDRLTESFTALRCPDGSELDNSDFIVPANLILTKQ